VNGLWQDVWQRSFDEKQNNKLTDGACLVEDPIFMLGRKEAEKITPNELKNYPGRQTRQRPRQ